MKKQSIYLTGFMGSGKSTVGRLLAARLRWPFVDLDETIVKEAGRSIPEIFQELGETAFRDMESEAVRRHAGEAGVYALGGGAVLSECNRSLLLSTGTVVYLRTAPGTLLQRLEKGTGERPLLPDDEDLYQTICRTLIQRKPFYESAHWIVDTDGMTAEQVVDELVNRRGGE